MLGPLLFLFGTAMLIAGFLASKSGRGKVKDVSLLKGETSESEEDIALYYKDKEAYYRNLGVFTEEEIREFMEKEHELDREYEEMKEEMKREE